MPHRDLSKYVYININMRIVNVSALEQSLGETRIERRENEKQRDIYSNGCRQTAADRQRDRHTNTEIWRRERRGSDAGRARNKQGHIRAQRDTGTLLWTRTP